MGDAPARLEITPRIIDLGGRIILLDNVASAAIATVHPLRGAARFALIAFGVLTLAELLRFQLWSTGKDAPLFSAIAALALLSLVAAIGLFLYRKRLLVVSTTDSQSTWIGSADADFLRLVLEAIRTAMTSSDTAFRAHVDLVAMTISGTAPAAGEMAGTGLSVEPATGAGWADAGPESALPHTINGARPESAPPPNLDATNGRAHEPARAPSFAEAMLREARTGTAIMQTAPPTKSNGREELEDVILLIEQASLPHKAELSALLDPVRDHLRGGRTGRRDAVHNWQLFHDYAGKYLTDVNGLADGCRRVEAALR